MTLRHTTDNMQRPIQMCLTKDVGHYITWRQFAHVSYKYQSHFFSRVFYLQLNSLVSLYMNHPVLARQQHGGTEESHGKPQSRSKFEPITSRTEVITDVAWANMFGRSDVVYIVIHGFNQLRSKGLSGRTDKTLSFKENKCNPKHLWIFLQTVLQGSVWNISPHNCIFAATTHCINGGFTTFSFVL